MPVFTYQALDGRGSEVVGTINADNERAAYTQVQRLGYHPLEIKVGGRAVSSGTVVGEVKRHGRRVKLPDLTMFTRQLANLVAGGLPIMRTLDALVNNTENARLYQILSQVRDDVSHGKSLCDSLSKHPRVFPSLYLSLVAAGEASGERVCVFPLDADYEAGLESKVADIKQCTLDGEADHILAARFLKRFTNDLAWVHMDLSASNCSGGLGGVGTDLTGFGVAWGVEFVEQWLAAHAASPTPRR